MQESAPATHYTMMRVGLARLWGLSSSGSAVEALQAVETAEEMTMALEMMAKSPKSLKGVKTMKLSGSTLFMAPSEAFLA